MYFLDGFVVLACTQSKGAVLLQKYFHMFKRTYLAQFL